MTSSPDLRRELRASRPTAPAALRQRVRTIAAAEPARPSLSLSGRLRLPLRRVALVAAPAALALAMTTAGVVGLSRSGDSTQLLREDMAEGQGSTSTQALESQAPPAPAQNPPNALADASGRAQRVTATLAIEVADPETVSRAAQEALDLARRLGGHVVSASVATGEQGSASLTVRVPVDRVQEAIFGLSGLGRIVSQQVAIEDLQEGIDASQRRIRSLAAQIALVRSRLESEPLDPATRTRLEARLKTLRQELRSVRRTVSSLRAEARMSTVSITIGTPEAFGGVAPASRLDRTLDEALNVLAWEGVVALAVLIVLAPFGLLAVGLWLAGRLYRRREEERLLAT